MVVRKKVVKLIEQIVKEDRELNLALAPVDNNEYYLKHEKPLKNR